MSVEHNSSDVDALATTTCVKITGNPFRSRTDGLVCTHCLLFFHTPGRPQHQYARSKSSCSNQGFRKKQMTSSGHNTTFSRTTDLKASLKDSPTCHPTEHLDCRSASDVCMIHCWCDAALFVFFQFARRAPVGDVTRHAVAARTATLCAAVSFRDWTREGGREEGRRAERNVVCVGGGGRGRGRTEEEGGGWRKERERGKWTLKPLRPRSLPSDLLPLENIVRLSCFWKQSLFMLVFPCTYPCGMRVKMTGDMNRYYTRSGLRD